MTTTANADSALLQLRAVAYRITALHSVELARIVPHLALHLSPCRSILSQTQPPGSEAASTVHQIKTRTSHLLQDRTDEHRFAGVALVKVLIDLGGWEVLHTSAPWVRSMISMLGRPSSNSTTVVKKMCMLALVQIFQQTHEHENLVREITTPNLPSFVSACLTILQTKEGQAWSAKQQELLQSVLSSWSALMPKHPTIFRPFISQIQKLLDRTLSLTPSQVTQDQLDIIAPATKDAARRVRVLLHGSATKTGTLQDRDAGCHAALQNARTTAHKLIICLYGDEESRETMAQNYFKINGDPPSIPDELLMVSMIEQLGLLEEYVATLGTKPHNLPIGGMVALVQFLTSAPTARSKSASTLNKNARQALLLDLPALRLKCLDLCYVILKRLGKSATSIAQDILDCPIDVLESHSEDEKIRSMMYVVSKQAIQLVGHDLDINTSRSLRPMVKQCCRDLWREQESATTPTKASDGKSAASVINPNAIIGASIRTKKRRKADPALQQAALALLTTLLSDVPTTSYPAAVRTEMERTAILADLSDALMASVLNARSGAPSLLPLAAQLSSDSLMLEAVLRPRMPAVVGNNTNDADRSEEEDEEMAHDNESNISTHWTDAQNMLLYNEAATAQELTGEDAEVADLKRGLDHEMGSSLPMSPLKRARYDFESNSALSDAADALELSSVGSPTSAIHNAGSAEVSAAGGENPFATVYNTTKTTDPAPLLPNEDMNPSDGLVRGSPDRPGVLTAVGKQGGNQNDDDDDNDDDDEDFVMPPLVMNKNAFGYEPDGSDEGD